MSNELTKFQPIKDLVERKMKTFTEALGESDAKVFVKEALMVLYKNTYLQECSPASILGCMQDAATLKLSFNSTQAEAYFVPYYNNKKKALECQFIPGYRGLMKLVRNYNEVEWISACLVYEHEKFELLEGTERRIIHTPLPPEKRGKEILGYAIVKYKDGTADFRYMWSSEIDAIREKSQSKIKDEYARKSSAWCTSEQSMRIKTVVRHLCSWLPKCPEAQKYANKDIYLENGIDISETDFEEKTVQPEPAMQKPRRTNKIIIPDEVKDKTADDNDDKDWFPPREPEPAGVGAAVEFDLSK